MFPQRAQSWRVSMPKIELIYFEGCPNIERARTAIRLAGVNTFKEINQAHLCLDDVRRSYSSPTVTLDGNIIAGIQNGGTACSIIDWPKISTLIATAVRNNLKK
jgi:hypothetical protein